MRVHDLRCTFNETSYQLYITRPAGHVSAYWSRKRTLLRVVAIGADCLTKMDTLLNVTFLNTIVLSTNLMFRESNPPLHFPRTIESTRNVTRVFCFCFDVKRQRPEQRRTCSTFRKGKSSRYKGPVLQYCILPGPTLL